MNKEKFINCLESLYKYWDDLAQKALADNDLVNYYFRAEKATTYQLLINRINRGDFD